MAQAYKPLQIGVEAYEELVALRTRLNELLSRKPKSISLHSVVKMLLAHLRNVPPDARWLVDELEKHPKRGQPKVWVRIPGYPEFDYRKDRV